MLLRDGGNRSDECAAAPPRQSAYYRGEQSAFGCRGRVGGRGHEAKLDSLTSRPETLQLSKTAEPHTHTALGGRVDPPPGCAR